MKKYRTLLVIAFACLVISNLSIAQDTAPQPVEPDAKKNDTQTDEDKTQENKPVYDVSLVFKKGMKFKESMYMNMDMNINESGTVYEQSILTDLGLDYDVLETENNKLKKVKLLFSKFKIVVKMNGREFDASKEAGFHCIGVFDKEDKIKLESTSEDFPEELKEEFNNMNLINYYPPTKGVKVGEEWKVDKKYLMKQFAQYELDDVESTMKLEKITTNGEGDNKIEIANIKITGTFKGKVANADLEITGKTEGTILIDITNHRILESSSSAKISGSGEGVTFTGSVTMKDTITYDEQLQTRPNKDENLKPKTDDDEE